MTRRRTDVVPFDAREVARQLEEAQRIQAACEQSRAAERAAHEITAARLRALQEALGGAENAHDAYTALQTSRALCEELRNALRVAQEAERIAKLNLADLDRQLERTFSDLTRMTFERDEALRALVKAVLR